MCGQLQNIGGDIGPCRCLQGSIFSIIIPVYYVDVLYEQGRPVRALGDA